MKIWPTAFFKDAAGKDRQNVEARNSYLGTLYASEEVRRRGDRSPDVSRSTDRHMTVGFLLIAIVVIALLDVATNTGSGRSYVVKTKGS